MAWLIWKSGSRKVYIGEKVHALDWAKQHEAAIVNCADRDYDWDPHCDRRWLKLWNFRGTLDGRTWIQHIEGNLRFVFSALERGEPVLLHCRKGKCRSGAATAMVIALLEGISYFEALELCVNKRGLDARDAAGCRDIAQKLDLSGVVDRLREEGFCKHHIQVATKSPSPPVPTKSPEQKQPEQKQMPTRREVHEVSVEKLWPNPTRLPLQTKALPGSGVPVSEAKPSSPPQPRLPRPPPGLPPPRLLLSRISSSTTTTEAQAMAAMPQPPCSREITFPVVTFPQATASLDSGVLGPDASRRSRSRSPSPELTDDRAWQCPECDTINPRSKMFCTSKSCGAGRPLLQHFRPGDWFCPACGKHNFRRRITSLHYRRIQAW